jgi:hypothetical protein
VKDPQDNRLLNPGVCSPESVNVGDGVGGSVSPWGICYPDDWLVMPMEERKEWKIKSSQLFLNRSLSNKRPPKKQKPAVRYLNVEQFRQHVKASSASRVEPAIPDAEGNDNA